MPTRSRCRSTFRDAAARATIGRSGRSPGRSRGRRRRTGASRRSDGIDAPRIATSTAMPRVGRVDAGAYEVAPAPPRPADGTLTVRSDAGIKSAGIFDGQGREVAYLFHNLPLPGGRASVLVPRPRRLRAADPRGDVRGPLRRGGPPLGVPRLGRRHGRGRPAGLTALGRPGRRSRSTTPAGSSPCRAGRRTRRTSAASRRRPARSLWTVGGSSMVSGFALRVGRGRSTSPSRRERGKWDLSGSTRRAGR